MKTFAFIALISIACSCSGFSTEQGQPVSDKIYTFADIEKGKAALKDNVVRLEILKLLGEPGDLGNGMLRFLAKDTSKGATPYGQVAFSARRFGKNGTRQRSTSRGPVYRLRSRACFSREKSRRDQRRGRDARFGRKRQSDLFLVSLS